MPTGELVFTLDSELGWRYRVDIEIIDSFEEVNATGSVAGELAWQLEENWLGTLRGDNQDENVATIRMRM